MQYIRLETLLNSHHSVPSLLTPTRSILLSSRLLQTSGGYHDHPYGKHVSFFQACTSQPAAAQIPYEGLWTRKCEQLGLRSCVRLPLEPSQDQTLFSLNEIRDDCSESVSHCRELSSLADSTVGSRIGEVPSRMLERIRLVWLVRHTAMLHLIWYIPSHQSMRGVNRRR